MPYRRLPNTDAARMRAMTDAQKKGQDIPPFKLAFTPKTYVRLQSFLPVFENTYQLQRQSLNKQVSSNKDYQEVVKKARTYISHFLKVMLLAVARGDMRKDTPSFFGFEDERISLPALNSEKEIIAWGNRVIEGETRRLRAGRNPVTNPTMAVVKVHFEKFQEAWQFQKTLNKRTSEYSRKISELRTVADEIIVDIWNEVESSFADQPEEIKRKRAEEYGLVYVFRKNELENNESSSASMHFSRG